MNTSYNDFLERLKEERLSTRWSQLQMGQRLRMSQSHYSKAELGTRRLTYYEIQFLCDTGVDVYYIFTGYRCKTEYNEFFRKCTYKELGCYLNMVCSVIECMYINDTSRCQDGLGKLIEFIQCVMRPYGNNKTAFYTLRCLMDYSQNKMADLLKVDVKKLRDLENGKVLPDSEMMWSLYKTFGISFATLLEDAKGLGCEIGYLLELIDDERRYAVFENIKTLHSILK